MQRIMQEWLVGLLTCWLVLALAGGAWAQVLGSSGGGSASASLLSQRVVYASKLPGIHLDSNFITGGGTSDSTVLNAALSGGNVHLIIDGNALLSASLVVSSNTTITILEGYGVYLASGSNCQMVINAHPSASVRTDRDITITGGTWNGNGGNNLGTNSDQVATNGAFCVGMGFFGCMNVRVSNLHIHDISAWAFCFSLCNYVNVNNIWHTLQGGTRTPAGAINQQDTVDIRGGCNFVTVRGLKSQAHDDVVAINTRDYSTSGLTGLTYLNYSPSTHIEIADIQMDTCSFGVALYSDKWLIDKVSVKGLRGITRNYVAQLSNDAPNAGLQGNGNFGSISFEDIDVDTISLREGIAAPYSYNEDFNIRANVRQLTIRNWRFNNRVDRRPSFRLRSGFSIQQLNVSGYHEYDNLAGSTSEARFVLQGTVKQANFQDINYFRDTSTTQGGNLVGITGGGVVSNLRLNGCTLNNTADVVSVDATSTCTLAAICNTLMSGSSSGAGLYNVLAGATVSKGVFSNSLGHAASVTGSGAAGVTKTGDSQ